MIAIGGSSRSIGVIGPLNPAAVEITPGDVNLLVIVEHRCHVVGHETAANPGASIAGVFQGAARRELD